LHIFFNATVSSGVAELRLQTTGGTGDCDLFVKRGSQPDYFDFAAYDHQSRHRKTPGGTEDGNEESIRITNPLPGTYYILVYGYSAFEGANLLVKQAGPPTILAPPGDLTVFEGQAARFTVQAKGTPPLSYQWRKGGEAISGATSAEFIVAAATRIDAGTYDVAVSNPHGTATSSTATLSVNALPHGAPVAWLQSFGFAGDPVEAELTDSDRDGHATWEEYLAGTDPTNANSVLQISDVRRQGAYFTFTFPTQMNRTYQVQFSENLEDWQTLIEELRGDGKRATAGDPRIVQERTRRFYRLAVEVSLPLGMVLIPAGEYQMGDAFSEGAEDELPVHTVNLSRFYMDKCEVTKALWDEVRQWALTNEVLWSKDACS